MSGDRFCVLIIGGYGTFGGRLARLLGDESRLRLLVGGARWKRPTISLPISGRRKMAPRASEATISALWCRPFASTVTAISPSS